MSEGGPVPGRACGACDACCVVFEITIPSIAKPAGERCRNLTASGCAIYESRPDMCRKWLCGWRLIPGLPEHWRPDLSGILIYQKTCTDPGYGTAAIVLALRKGLEHLQDSAVLGFVQNMVATGVPLYLTLYAEGVESRAAFLNPILEPLVRDNKGGEFIASLARLITELRG